MNRMLKQKLQELDYLNTISSQLGWDEATQMPIKAAAHRSDIQAYVSGRIQHEATSDILMEIIHTLSQKETLTDIEKAVIRNSEKYYRFYNAMPKEFYMEMSKSFSEGFHAWEEARKKNNYAIFAPKLKQNIELSRQLACAMGYEQNPYDGLLNHYEEGLSTRMLDQIFDEVKTECVSLMDKIYQRGSVFNPISGHFAKCQQKTMAQDLLNTICFDLEAGHLAESTHPFTGALTPTDVRLTINYNEHDFTDVFFATLHEGGHGLYEQNINPDLYGTTLCQGSAMSIHESCSRMIENQVGRSKEFLTFYLPKLKEFFPELSNLTSEELYRAVNHSEASLIRIHADEISYNLHIIIRYEMEKAIMNDNIPVEELPALWNVKYQKYLRVSPSHDNEGILQDIHWSGMLMGYFPSYALGSIYAAQIFDRFNRDIQFDFSQGDIKPLIDKMKEHLYCHGSVYTPEELITKITGDTINTTPYLEYLKNKIQDIYQISV